jgi:hypothetical protein
MNKYTKFALAIGATFAVVGCGGGSSSSADKNVGVYEDAAIDGVEYNCGTKAGVTKDGGKFEYEIGKSCKFSIGELVLREVNAAVVNSANLHIKEFNLNNVDLLAYLDKDGNLDNGIEIDLEAAKKAVDEAGGKDSSVDDIVEVYVDSVDKSIGDILKDRHSHIHEHINSHIDKQFETIFAHKNYYAVVDGSVVELKIGDIKSSAGSNFLKHKQLHSDVRSDNRDLILEIALSDDKDPHLFVYNKQNRDEVLLDCYIVAQNDKGLVAKDANGHIKTLYESKKDALNAAKK